MGRWGLEGSFCGMFGGGGAYDGGCDNGGDDDDGCDDEEDDEGDDDDNYNDGVLDIYATCEQRRCRDSSKSDKRWNAPAIQRCTYPTLSLYLFPVCLPTCCRNGRRACMEENAWVGYE